MCKELFQWCFSTKLQSGGLISLNLLAYLKLLVLIVFKFLLFSIRPIKNFHEDLESLLSLDSPIIVLCLAET